MGSISEMEMCLVSEYHVERSGDSCNGDDSSDSAWVVVGVVTEAEAEAEAVVVPLECVLNCCCNSCRRKRRCRYEIRRWVSPHLNPRVGADHDDDDDDDDVMLVSVTAICRLARCTNRFSMIYARTSLLRSSFLTGCYR